jgi:hypothetical protein
MLGVFLLAGCSAPPAKRLYVTMEPDGSLQSYRKVHILPLPRDYRHLQVKLLTRLRGLGFEADIIDPKRGLDRSQGTAFLISREGHLLTCAHVLGENEKATVWLAGNRYEAGVVRRDTANDLALLKLSAAADLPLVPIAPSPNTKYTLGQDVFTIGFPLSDILGSAPRLSKGLVSATVGLNDNPQHLQVSAEIQPGNSGGPLLDNKGDFVGIVSSTLNPMNVLARTGGSLPQNVNFAIKNGVIREFLDRAGLRTTLQGERAGPVSFETVKNSVALVRSGVRTKAEEEQPEMICRILYEGVSAVELRFRYFVIDFHDLKTGKELLRTGLSRGERDNSEEGVLNRAIEEIRRNFFAKPSPPKKSG